MYNYFRSTSSRSSSAGPSNEYNPRLYWLNRQLLVPGFERERPDYFRFRQECIGRINSVDAEVASLRTIVEKLRDRVEDSTNQLQDARNQVKDALYLTTMAHSELRDCKHKLAEMERDTMASLNAMSRRLDTLAERDEILTRVEAERYANVKVELDIEVEHRQTELAEVKLRLAEIIARNEELTG